MSCINLKTDPHEIVAIELDPLPWPSVVAGDSLRDASGAAVALRARLFDATGAVVTNQPINFFSRDTAVTVDSLGFVVARPNVDLFARLIASGAGLQSKSDTVQVVPRPDSVGLTGTIDTLALVIPDVAATNTSRALAVKVVSHDTTDIGVRAWIVSFSLAYRGANIAASDTSQIFLVDDAGRLSVVDTTDTQGTASRRVRFKNVPGTAPSALDSVIVTAKVNYKGAPLAGSPVRLVLPVRPKT